MIGTALAVLVGAAAAYAAYNNYSGTTTKISKGVGSKSKPVGLSMVQTLKVSAPSGERAAPLTNIKTNLYGVKLDPGGSRSAPTPRSARTRSAPPGPAPRVRWSLRPGELLLGPGTNPSASAGTPCNPRLNVFNGGPNTQVFYFWTKSSSDCEGG